VSTDGWILLDSNDVRATDDPSNLAYHEANRRAGRYIGEIRLQLEFQGTRGSFAGWLHVDPETLNERCGILNWGCDVIVHEKSGDYLAKLTKRQAT
jgi:hypothetical protein